MLLQRADGHGVQMGLLGYERNGGQPVDPIRGLEESKTEALLVCS